MSLKALCDKTQINYLIRRHTEVQDCTFYDWANQECRHK